MERPLQQVSIDLVFERAYAFRAIREENLTDWESIKDFLRFLGYDARFVYVTFRSAMPVHSQKKIIHFPAAGKRVYEAGRGFYSAPSPA